MTSCILRIDLNDSDRVVNSAGEASSGRGSREDDEDMVFVVASENEDERYQFGRHNK